jgi:hypothetical protein
VILPNDMPCITEDCEGRIALSIAYEPPDPSYGADADGNRGIYVPGFYYAEYTGEECTKGCKFDRSHDAALEARAAMTIEGIEEDDDPRIP